MGKITQATATNIWMAYREIEAGKEILRRIETDIAEGKDPTPLDAFGNRKKYQFGVPSGENSHRLYDVNPNLAKSVIIAHIAEKEKELTEANEQARIELGIES